jgi:hypothetical protein
MTESSAAVLAKRIPLRERESSIVRVRRSEEITEIYLIDVYTQSHLIASYQIHCQAELL